VIGFFEVIRTSAPHIYNSALLLSPRMSTIWKLYQSLCNPLTRVIQGVPPVWDPSVVNKRFTKDVTSAAWSPCSRFIAFGMGFSRTVQVLDAVTLEQLYTLSHTNPVAFCNALVFSPDSCLLTGQCVRSDSILLISWDLQTGGLVSEMQLTIGPIHTVLYSRCGTMLGVLQTSSQSPRSYINTYNILSGTLKSSYECYHPIAGMIWTHSGCFRCVILGSESMTIWEVGPTPSHVSTEVASLPTPDNLPPNSLALSPSLLRISYIYQDRVLVWDAQHSRILLDSADPLGVKSMTFSSDELFFACTTKGLELYLWKESTNGYLLHHKFVSSHCPAIQVTSPGKVSIITIHHSMVHMWHITSSPTSPSDIPTRTPKDTPGCFVLDFSPDNKLVAVTRKFGKGIYILDLKSGNLQWIIDTAEEVHTVQVLGSTIIACCDDGKIITWDLPAGDYPFNISGDIQKGVKTIAPEHFVPLGTWPRISISPDFGNIATVKDNDEWVDLKVYNMNSGELLAVHISRKYNGMFTLDREVWWPTLEYTPDGSEIWYAPNEENHLRWKIVKDGESDITGLECLKSTECPPGGFSWNSPHGYQIMGDGWILNSNNK